MSTAKPALHHVAFACRDLDATNHFYNDVLGLPLVHTEIAERDGGTMKHVFYDLGDGSCLAFFWLQGMGEPAPLRTDISTGLGLPVWVNHLAIRATDERVEATRQRLADEGIAIEMELDHDWCRSTYIVDPNGILVELCVDTPGFVPDPEGAERLRRQPVGTPAGTAP